MRPADVSLDTGKRAQAAPPLPRRVLILLAAVFLVVWFGNLDYRKLIRPDEGRYAEIAREMAASGDWITPRLNGIKYFEKPPLQYWAGATSFRLFGEDEWTARLWPALTGFFGVALVFFAGRRLFGPAAGLCSAVVLASSAGYVGIAHMNTLDMGLTFFMTATLIAFLLARQPGADARTGRNWMLVAWAAAALAVLSKGLVGVVLPAAVLALYMAIERDFALLRRLHWGAGGAIFLAIAAPWFVLVQLANPEFASFFFVREHFDRFLTQVHRRVEPWWYFLPMLAIGMWPWLTVLPPAMARAWRRADEAADFHPARFLLIWTAFIFVFFSLSSSKLPSYILPIFPALALLAGATLARTPPRVLAWHAVPSVIAGAIIAAISPLAARLGGARMPSALYEAYGPWIFATGAALAIAGAGTVWLCLRARPYAGVLALGFGGLLAAQLATSGHNALAPAYSGYALAQQLKPHLIGDVPFYSVRTYDQSLPFYIKRTVTLVAFQDEMAYGLKYEPRLWLPDVPSFERAWRNERSALAIMEPGTYEELQGSGLPMQVVARDIRRIVVKKPAAGQ